MKVFISHKDSDSKLATKLKKQFERCGVSAYLDVLDNNIITSGKALTDHIKEQLNNCTDIIVLMSENTKLSWWVPFEIGMAAQVDMPTASFLNEEVPLPDYLEYWPRLRTLKDIEKYVNVRKRVSLQLKIENNISNTHYSRATETRLFYDRLKIELRLQHDI